MLRRTIEDNLMEWKNKSDKKCLMISGARQVGKTYIVEKFAKENYENFVEINFVENPTAKKIFDGDLDINSILANISLYIPEQSHLVPNKTLIFFDEIQVCPNARTALKFFAIDKRFDVIASGSLLGINYEQVSSYPTGYVEFLEMNPLSFIEFLWANGVEDSVISIIKDCYETKSIVNDAMNFKLLEYFKQYIVVGGMPNVVNTFINNHNYEEVLNLQKNILIDYKNDIAKYAVAMKGIDYIIFTGGIGENQINIRKGICEKLEFMGVKLDLDANNMRGEEKVISTPDSKVKVYLIPTNEELMIAKETKRLVK